MTITIELPTGTVVNGTIYQMAEAMYKRADVREVRVYVDGSMVMWFSEKQSSSYVTK